MAAITARRGSKNPKCCSSCSSMTVEKSRVLGHPLNSFLHCESVPIQEDQVVQLN